MDRLPYTVATPQYSDAFDSASSTPYVSAPSSPGRETPPAGYYYYSAPASPTHFKLSSTAALASYNSAPDPHSSFEFDFSSTFPSPESSPMSSADELFFNGQIRPMKLRPRRPLSPLREEDDRTSSRVACRDSKLRRRTRSMSPDRTPALHWSVEGENDTGATRRPNHKPAAAATRSKDENESDEPAAAAGGRRGSRRWISLKEFLYRSKSEGHRIWGSKKNQNSPILPKDGNKKNHKNGVAKRRPPSSSVPSAHEMHYTANRAQAEEMRKKTFLPYRQGLLGCLGFNAKGYGAISGFTRALNSVSSR